MFDSISEIIEQELGRDAAHRVSCLGERTLGIGSVIGFLGLWRAADDHLILMLLLQVLEGNDQARATFITLISLGHIFFVLPSFNLTLLYVVIRTSILLSDDFRRLLFLMRNWRLLMSFG